MSAGFCLKIHFYKFTTPYDVFCSWYLQKKKKKNYFENTATNYVNIIATSTRTSATYRHGDTRKTGRPRGVPVAAESDRRMSRRSHAAPRRTAVAVNRRATAAVASFQSLLLFFF